MWLHKNVNVKADQLGTHQNQKTRNDLMTFLNSFYMKEVLGKSDVTKVKSIVG